MSRQVYFEPIAGGVGDRVRISKPGIDVRGAGVTDEDLLFSSDWENVLRIYKQGTLSSVPTGGTKAFLSWPSLGYIPFSTIMFWSSLDGNWQPYSAPTPYLGSGKFVHALVFADGIQYSSSGYGTVLINYTVFRAQAFAS